MSRELTLEQAAERARQTEIIARLVEDFPTTLPIAKYPQSPLC